MGASATKQRDAGGVAGGVGGGAGGGDAARSGTRDELAGKGSGSDGVDVGALPEGATAMWVAPLGWDGRAARPMAAMRRASLDDDLLAYLCDVDIVAASEDALAAHPAFTRNVDNPRLKRHVYFEGVFHGRPTRGTVRSMHPRFGGDFEKRALPPRLAAFSRALRDVNSAWLSSLADALEALAGDEEGAAATMARLVREGNAFADAAVQVHAREGVDADGAGWHTDAPNSALHLAVGLRGRRALLFKAGDAPDAAATVHEAPQAAGSCYLSSPFAFPHAVTYDVEGEWDRRVVAVQMRLLMTRAELMAMFGDEGEWNAILGVITRAVLGPTPLRLPTLAEVMAAEAATEAEAEAGASVEAVSVGEAEAA
uniref:Uncharacterized protein n=1 Tax=Bicosoecida sp. CB-2014 TaxID=1486930 RepID=A0A7S1CPJ8_9STRA